MKMHRVRLKRPFKHGSDLYEGTVELNDDALARAKAFGLIDDGEKSKAKRTPKNRDAASQIETR